MILSSGGHTYSNKNKNHITAVCNFNAYSGNSHSDNDKTMINHAALSLNIHLYRKLSFKDNLF